MKVRINHDKPFAVCRINLQNTLTVIPTKDALFNKRYHIFKTFDTFEEADNFRAQAWAIYLQKKAQSKHS